MNYHNLNNSRPACEQFSEMLESWHANELDDKNKLFMQVHHDTCPSCQHEKTLALQIDEISRSLPEQKCPPLTILDELTSKTPGPNQHSGLLTRLIAAWKQPLVLVPACSAILTAVLIFTIIRPDQKNDEQLLIISGNEYTEDEIRQAVEDLEMALQYIDKYSRYPGQIVTTELTESPLPFKKRDDTDAPPI